MFGESLLQNEQYRSKLQKSNERSLSLIKAGMDIVVAVGLLQLAPKKVTPRVTGAFGFVSSLISCYQVYINSYDNFYICFLFITYVFLSKCLVKTIKNEKIKTNKGCLQA